MLPVFETSRLALTRFAPQDAPGFCELNADPEVLRYAGGDEPFASVAEAEAFIRAYSHYKRHGYGRWSVYLQETGEYLGFCGLNYNDRLREVDVGFRLMRRYWGRGYATEAARASLRHGFEAYGLGKIVGRALPDNLASPRVLEKIGMRYAKMVENDGLLWRQYEITREEAGFVPLTIPGQRD
jgi:ribosomal-protein-alanine N-acetyltransferase